jgi:hypothetical protein
MPLFPPQDYRKTAFTHRIGLAADQPSASDVLPGTLWFSSDTFVLERSNGTIWENYSAGGGVGPPGPTGAQGSAGSPGFDGEQGDTEFFPIPGPIGATGATGSSGITGPPGLTGEQGEQGESGFPGVAGVAGAAGAAGTRGLDGPPGIDGLEGEQGDIGLPGPAGVAGATGAIGSIGPPGIPGLDGEEPTEPFIIAGPQGIQGEPGFTATQIILTDFTQDLGEAERSGTFNVTGLSGLTVGENVLVVQTKQAIASKGDATDEPEMDLIRATGIVISATTFAVSWLCESVVVGTYAFAYAFGGAIATLPSVVQGDMLYGSAPDTIVALPKDTNASRYVSNQGASNNPKWDRVSLTDGVVGTLPDGNLSANVPLLDAFNVFSNNEIIQTVGGPLLILGATGEAVDEKYQAWQANGPDLRLLFLTDGLGFLSTGLIINRSSLIVEVNEMYSGAGYLEFSRSVVQGDWQAVAFNAADFSATPGMTWTVASGDVLINRYMMIGHTLFWNISIRTATLTIPGGAGLFLLVTIPGGNVGAFYQRSPVSYMEDNAVIVDGHVSCNVTGVTQVSIGRYDGSNWNAGNAAVDFNICFEVQ